MWLGLWWAVETVTTVGYGDIVPHQTIGKVLAAFMMLGGLSLIAVLTAAITSGFIARAQTQQQDAGDDPVMDKLRGDHDELNAVKAELAQLRPPTGTGAEG